jgi:hypothetical protein
MKRRDLVGDLAAVFACHGKEAFATKARAMDVIHRRQRNAKRRFGGKESHERRDLMRLGVYHCTFCHHWHVGGDHDPKAPR